MKKISIILVTMILLLTPTIASVDSSVFQSNEQKDNQVEEIQHTYNSFFVEGNTSYSFIQQKKTSINKNFHFKNQSFSIDKQEIQLKKTKNQYTLFLSNSSLFNQPNLPLLPMKTIKIALPNNVTVHSINVNKCTIQKSKEILSFQQTPSPHFWSVNKTPLHKHTSEIIQNNVQKAEEKKIYPGTTHTSIVGKNKTQTTVIIHLFPVQYHLNTKETFLLKNGTVTVSYVFNNEEKNNPIQSDKSIENIIITHPTFVPQAKKLQQFHNNQGIKTEVFTTKWIESSFEPASYPPIKGYRNFSFKDKIRKYDDELALKIISFLQSQSTNPYLQFITILGNAIHVPPSYYFGYDYYPVPTDFYYSSPDLDLIPNYQIGRLPVHTFFEATRAINKIINWNPTEYQMNNVAIAGGIPFNSPFFIGELITIDSVNRGFFNKLNVDKYFRTNNQFQNTDITTALQNEYGLLYLICHGNANLIVAENGRVSARNLGNMPKNNKAPIISCIACSSGSFDTHLIRQGFSFDKTSFGEGVVTSKGAGIAYIGGSRTNNGYPLLTLDKGRVVISKETYMAGLLTYVNQAYKKNVNHLGDLTKFAAEKYLEKNDMTDFWNQYHYFSFVLLGDPALSLPQRSFEQESYTLPQSMAKKPVANISYQSTNNDYSGSISLHAIDELVQYESQTNSSFVNLKQISTGNLQNLEIQTSTHSTHKEKVTVSFTPSAASLSLLRFETMDGKEDWLYYQTARPVDDDFSQETTGFNSTRWNTIQNAINNANSNDFVYVLNGTYNESIIIDKSCNLHGENKSITCIDGKGNDNVITILSDGVIISDFTIQHCGKNPHDAAINIQPKKSWNSLPITIINNVVSDNKNCGIFIDINNKFFSPKIYLQQNKIIHNNFGIFIQNGADKKYISSNAISNNNYGIYVIDSKNDYIFLNNFKNNFVGLFFKTIKNGMINSNNFIDNTQHCQFTKTIRTRFKSNYWDDWIGLYFEQNLPIPKLINGFHDTDYKISAQFKIDLHPVKEPYELII